MGEDTDPETEKCESYTPHKESYYNKKCLVWVHTGVKGWCTMLQMECDGLGNRKPKTIDAKPVFQHGIPAYEYYREV